MSVHDVQFDRSLNWPSNGISEVPFRLYTDPEQPVGWAERREAHHRCRKTMGFAALNPPYFTCAAG